LLKNSQKHLPRRNVVRLIIEKFRETGSVLDAERSGRPSKFKDKKLMDISDSTYAAESIKIIAQVGARERYRLATAHKAVRENLKLFP
jgi:transposase